MDLLPAERTSYFSGLRSTYGREIVSSDASLDAATQRSIEVQRHEFNSQWPNEAERIAPAPQRLLVSMTQYCTFDCPHCWVFSSPHAKERLGCDDLHAIHAHTREHGFVRWTATGGEFFAHPDWDEILARFPIDCVYTNGFWGASEERCQKYVRRLASALGANPYLGERRPTLIVSYDKHHVEGNPLGFHLAKAIATIIARITENLPQLAIRISHAQSAPGDCSYLEVLCLLEEAGFELSRTLRNGANGNIENSSCRVTCRSGLTKEIFIDSYPTAAVSRALIPPQSAQASWNSAGMFKGDARPRARYEYAVGADGGVGLYSILYAPPAPYCIGNLIREPWSVIAQRLGRDPIAITLLQEGLEPFVAFMDEFYPSLQRTLAQHFHSIQQYMYLCLLDCDRRLLLNAWLSARLQARRRRAMNST